VERGRDEVGRLLAAPQGGGTRVVNTCHYVVGAALFWLLLFLAIALTGGFG
jgi:hypothetical protein